MMLTNPKNFNPLTTIDSVVHLAESTRKQYRKALERYLATGASITDPDALSAYAKDLPSSSRAFLKAAIRLLTNGLARSIKGVATPDNVDAVQAALYRLEALQDAIQVDSPKGQKAHRWLSKHEVRMLFLSCDNERDRLVLALLVGAGLRRSEAVSLSFGDVRDQPVSEKTRTVLEIRGKGAKYRVVPISDDLAKMVGQGQGKVLRSRYGESLSSEAVYQIVGRCGKVAGFENLQPHDLRRTYCQLGYEAGVPLPQLSKLMGHASIQTTQRYLNLDLDLEVTVSDFVPVG